MYLCYLIVLILKNMIMLDIKCKYINNMYNSTKYILIESRYCEKGK